MRIVGLDLSLTSTGIAVIDAEIVTATITSKGSKDATLAERGKRLERIKRDVIMAVGRADLVVIEGPSFGQARQGGQHDRAGLWWLVVGALAQPPIHDRAPIRVVEVPPASRSKYATGKGNAAKDAVLAAVIRRYPEVEVAGNDQADALVLAAMGARRYGEPLEDALPATHIAALDKVRWPS